MQLGDAEWAAPTECPLWSVGDIYAHLAGGEEWVAAGYPRATDEFQDWVDAGVLARRGRPRTDVLRELRQAYTASHALIGVTEPEAPAIYPWGVPTTFARLIETRAFDCWTHEQDIRRAVGRPGNLGSPGAHLTARVLAGALPRVVARGAGAPPGTTVRLVTTGEVALDLMVAVDPRGRAGSVPPGGDEPTGWLRLPWEVYARLSAGRGSAADHEIELGGDRELAGRVLSALSVTP
jgi:uncharacterized protein (TIGR03083 family)